MVDTPKVMVIQSLFDPVSPFLEIARLPRYLFTTILFHLPKMDGSERWLSPGFPSEETEIDLGWESGKFPLQEAITSLEMGR